MLFLGCSHPREVQGEKKGGLYTAGRRWNLGRWVPSRDRVAKVRCDCVREVGWQRINKSYVHSLQICTPDDGHDRDAAGSRRALWSEIEKIQNK